MAESAPKSYPGLNGIPFFTNAKEKPNIREEELEVGGTTETYVLDTLKKEDIATYNGLKRDESRGQLAIGVEERQWVPDEKSWRIFICVVRYYLKLKTETIVL